MRVVDCKGKIGERPRLVIERLGKVIGKDERKEREAREALAFGFDRRLPEGGLGRVLALWGFTSVPFFRALLEPAGDGASGARVVRRRTRRASEEDETAGLAGG